MMNVAIKSKQNWLTNFCDNKRVFVSVVIIQIAVIIYAISALAFDLRFLYSLSILTLFAQLIGMTLLISLCKLKNRLNRFNVINGVLIVVAIVIIQTSLLAQLVGFFNLQLSLQLITGDVSINFINLKLTLSAVIICLALLRYFYVQDQWQLHIQKLADARLIALQARIKPHFLFNSLNSIAALIGLDADKAELAITDFSGLMRRTFSHLDHWITLGEELQWVEQYLALEKLRLDKRLTYELTCPEDLLHHKIPVLCIQPLVENAIVHGLQTLPDGGKIQVNITATHSVLMFKISNPYKKQPVHTGSNGMALQNIRERLSLHYANKAELHTEAAGGFFTVKLRIPL